MTHYELLTAIHMSFDNQLSPINCQLYYMINLYKLHTGTDTSRATSENEDKPNKVNERHLQRALVNPVREDNCFTQTTLQLLLSLALHHSHKCCCGCTFVQRGKRGIAANSLNRKFQL